MEAEAQFQVSFPGSPANAVDMLGLWQTADAPAAGAGVIWRADLPADPARAEEALKQHGRALWFARQALDAAPTRLSHDLGLLRGGVDPQELAFDLDNQPADSSRSVLQRAYLYGLDAASFGETMDQDIVEDITGVITQFSAQVQRLVGQMALVESSSGGWKQGVTRVTWSGGVDTWFAPSAGPLQTDQHCLLLAQSLATRQAWLHFLLRFSAGAVRVGIALATPTFLPLTLWTTWKYLQGLVTEYRQLSSQVRAV